MKAVRFPKMLDNNKTAVIKDLDATSQNIQTLIMSTRQTLLGDPFFGTNLQKLFYEPNNTIVRDLVIDGILEALHTYIKQITVERENISIEQEYNTITVRIYAQNNLDYSFNEYTLQLLEGEEI